MKCPCGCGLDIPKDREPKSQHTPTPEIKNDHIVEQFARALVANYMGEAWKWKIEEYELTVYYLREKIVRAVKFA